MTEHDPTSPEAAPRFALANPSDSLAAISVFACFAVALVGCGSQHCWPDGTCASLPSNFVFYLRWTLAGILWATTVVLIAVSIQEDAYWLLLLGAMLSVGGFFTQSGCTAPWAQALGAAEDRRREEEKGREAEAGRQSPVGQLEASRSARDKVAEKLAEQIKPLVAKYQAELDGYLAELGMGLKAAGVASHEQLLAESDQHQRLAQRLNRAAVLRTSLAWLGQKQRDAERLLGNLDQQAWRTEKMIEMNAVASPEDMAAVKKILAVADQLLDEKIAPPERQDVARAEAELFAELTAAPSASTSARVPPKKEATR